MFTSHTRAEGDKEQWNEFTKAAHAIRSSGIIFSEPSTSVEMIRRCSSRLVGSTHTVRDVVRVLRVRNTMCTFHQHIPQQFVLFFFEKDIKLSVVI